MWSNDNVLRDEEDDVKIENIRQDSIEEHSSILEVRQFIQSDLQPKNLNIGQQNKHIEGTNEYKQYKAKYAQKNQYGPSRLLVGIKEVQNLINQYAGTGKIKVNQKGVWNKTEVILSNDRIVGKVVNNMNGKESETTVFKIHYGNDGVHIVPDYPSKRKGKK